MMSGISTFQASNVATPSLETRTTSQNPPAKATAAPENIEDTVQLSSTGQQHLAASSQAERTAAPQTVAQVIQSAAEGNIAALSLLVVV